MADIAINSLEDGRSGCDSLKSAASNVDAARSEGASGFQVLTHCTPDLGSGFINELTKSLDDIYNFISGNLYTSADGYFQKEPEETVPETEPDIGGPSGGVPGGGGPRGTGTPTPTAVTDPPTTPVTTSPETTVPETTTPETAPIAAVKLSELDTSSLTELQLSSLNGLVDQMIELANQNKGSLDSFVESDEYSDKIKQMLLESPYVPQELKAIIMDLDSSVVRLLLEYILKGNSPEIFDLNTLNLGIIYSCLDDVAKNNNLTIDELINNSKNAQILKEGLSQFDDVIDLIKGWEELSNEDFQEQLSAFYYGDVSEEFPTHDITTTRNYVDYLADACDVSYEELLTDNSYAETLKEGAIEFGKALSYFKSTSFFSTEGMIKNVSKLYDGSNYKAYGMTKDTVDSFKKEIDSVAQQNGTTSDNLLSNSQYADTVKDALLKSEAASGVGLIYKNAESSTSQNVAKNLYNTSFEESEQQKKLDELAKKAAETSKTEKTGSVGVSASGVSVKTALSGEDKK